MLYSPLRLFKNTKEIVTNVKREDVYNLKRKT